MIMAYLMYFRLNYKQDTSIKISLASTVIIIIILAILDTSTGTIKWSHGSMYNSY